MKHISVKQVGPVVVLKPRGNLMGGNECDELRMAAEEAGKQGTLSLVIDLQGVEYINSSGIGELVVLLHLVRVFDIYESEEEAVASFAAARPEPQAS
jgi:anti-anti-sigma factor